MTEGPRNASRKRAARCWLPAVAFTLLLQAACSQTRASPLPAADLPLLASADIPGLEETGHLREGYLADVVVFDPDRFAPMADYVHRRELSRDVAYLRVKGRLAIADGKLTGIAAGRVRLHTPTPGTCPGRFSADGCGPDPLRETHMIGFA